MGEGAGSPRREGRRGLLGRGAERRMGAGRVTRGKGRDRPHAEGDGDGLKTL